MFRILVINPGSTSTKIAVFDSEKNILTETISHDPDKLAQYERIMDQFNLRWGLVERALRKKNIPLESLSAVAARGGLLRAIPGGVYRISELMLDHLKDPAIGEHASNLGAVIAHAIGEKLTIPTFIVDPVIVDEMGPLARYSGHPKIPRMSIFHALNQKASARKAAEELGKNLEDCRFIIAHMGGGISVGAHSRGKVVDVNNALNGDGPFSSERTGGLPAGQLVKLCFSGDYTEKEISRMIKGKGGLYAYLGTTDLKAAGERMDQGDGKAFEVIQAMAYQVAKEIASLSAVLFGEVDAVILTGGMAHSPHLIEAVTKRTKHIAPVMVLAGENEMEALRDGALRVLKGDEEPKDYQAVIDSLEAL